MRTAILVTLGAAVVSAQNFTSCCSLDPNTVDMNTRLAWCRAQQNSCPLVCADGLTSANTCDPNALTFSCVCQSGTTPNISDYGQTLPSLECDEWKGQCVNAHPNNLAGQTFCLSFTCGDKNASNSGLGPSSGGGAGGSAATSTAASSSSSTSATSTSSSSAAAATMIQLGREYGTGAMLVGVMAIFGLAL